MIKNILITRKIPEVAVSLLAAEGFTVDVNEKEGTLTTEEIIDLLKQRPYDGVITLLTDKIDASVFDSAPSVKIFSNYASGYDNLDVKEASVRGITVTNAPTDLTGEAVAEHTLTLLLALVNRIVEADKFVRDGKYKGWDPMLFVGSNLSQKTIGIIGGGRIGERVADFCHSLGLKIIYNDVNPNPEFEKKFNAIYYKPLEEFLPIADFVTLHVPLLPSTKHLINEKNLRLMKSTAFLINTSRGGVIDEVSLERALREKIIAGAALDVFEFEPEITAGLTSLSNVILTPHIASADLEVRDAMAKTTAQNIIDFFDGKTLVNKVN
ncbi:MAG: D-glycerate dehydrogenase [Candidatus Pacebacteria bacterium]|nr:D-glycerate dehydrogenase [Candidatus Paceibacterota bacterium]